MLGDREYFVIVDEVEVRYILFVNFENLTEVECSPGISYSLVLFLAST